MRLSVRGILNGLLLFALIVFAVNTSVTANAQAKAVAPKPVKVSEAEADKYAAYRDKSTPGMIRAMHIHGTITLEFTVNTGGRVEDIVPIAGDTKNDMIVKYSRDTVSHWQYSPYLVSGKPTPMRTTTTIKYNE
jgi:outer membrane biosynthesis protein TonB